MPTPLFVLAQCCVGARVLRHLWFVVGVYSSIQASEMFRSRCGVVGNQLSRARQEKGKDIVVP